MIFKITGIDRPETARFKVTMHHLDTKKNYGTGNTLYEAESWSSRFQFEPGNWILTVEDDDLGVAERPFAIEPGGETRVVVRGSDFKK